MAYMSQETKKALAPAIKAVLKKYKIKASIAVQHYSTLVVNIKSGDLDILGNCTDDYRREYIQVNPYCIDKSFTGTTRDFLTELLAAMNKCDTEENHNNSDVYSDYHDVGWYNSINVGQYNKPYELNV